MRLLVGDDGSDGGRDALELARVLGEATGASTQVVTVPTHGPLPIGRGSVAAAINDLAAREEIDTIVVGSPHRGAVGRVVIGSVADGLLHGAPCEVAVAPSGYAAEEHGPFRTIAVAYDDTPESKVALARAEAIALGCRATIVIDTISAPPAVVPGAAGYVPTVPLEAGAIVTGAVKSVDERLAATGRALSGVPGPALIDACEEVSADLLVAGSRGHGAMARALLGSVSTQLAHKARCPVLVVPGR